MIQNLQLTATSGFEPLELSKVKDYLRQSSDDDDVFIQELIRAARVKAEQVLGRSLMVHSYNLEVNGHEGVIYLPMPPHGTVSSITYWDGDEWQSLTETTDYTVYGLDNKYIAVSVAYQRLRIVFATTAYTNYDVNRIMMELVEVWYDNRADAEELELKVVKKLSKYKIWQAA